MKRRAPLHDEARHVAEEGALIVRSVPAHHVLRLQRPRPAMGRRTLFGSSIPCGTACKSGLIREAPTRAPRAPGRADVGRRSGGGTRQQKDVGEGEAEGCG